MKRVAWRTVCPECGRIVAVTWGSMDGTALVRAHVAKPGEPCEKGSNAEIHRREAGPLTFLPTQVPAGHDHCHEDMGDDPCGKKVAGYRYDAEHGEPYPVCAEHLRPPFTKVRF